MLIGSDICRLANQDLDATGMIVTMVEMIGALEMIETMEMIETIDGMETAIDVSKCQLLTTAPSFAGRFFYLFCAFNFISPTVTVFVAPFSESSALALLIS